MLESNAREQGPNQATSNGGDSAGCILAMGPAIDNSSSSSAAHL